MRVIQIAGGGDRGGAKTHIISLCSHLKDNCELSLVSLRSGDFADSASDAGIDTHTIYSKSTIKDYYHLIKYIKKEKPDIVHCHGAKANIAGRLVKLFCGSSIATTIHSDYKIDYMHNIAKRLTIGFLNAIALRHFDYYISVSENTTQMLIKRGFEANRIMTLRNGLDFSTQYEKENRAEYLKSCGLEYEEGDVLLGISARLTPVKDIPTLLRAFALANKRCPNTKLLIAGDGEEYDKLTSLTKELGIDKSVAFLGWISEVPRFFSMCDIDVLSSVSEGLPYSLLEGIREGCAVITSNVGGIGNLIDHGINGYIFDSGDVEAFAEYIVDLATDSGKRKDFASLLYRKASAVYSIEKMAETQLSIYENILQFEQYRKNRYGVLICGAYGRGNSGDEAILRAIIDSVKSASPLVPITVMTKKPLETSLKHGVNTVYTFKVLSFLKVMKRCSVFINGGGNLIQDSTSSRSLFFYLYTIRAAKKRDCKVLMYGCGIGKVRRKFNRKITKLIIDKNADIITLRDSISKKDLDAMGITRPDVRLTADPAMSVIPASVADAESYLKANGINPSGNYICFSLRQWGNFSNYNAFVTAAEYAYNTHGLTPLFLPIEVPRDLDATHSVVSSLKCPYHILKPPADAPLLISVFGKMKAVCAIRLHALVFAARSGAPFFAASYDIKVNGFMEYIGKNQLCCNLSDINGKWLCDAINKITAGDNESPAAKLQALEKGNVAALKELLN